MAFLSVVGVAALFQALRDPLMSARQVEVYDVSFFGRAAAPASYSDEELFAFLDTRANDAPPPAGWTVLEGPSRVKAVLTSETHPRTGAYRAVVTVLDDSEDLVEASAHLDGQRVEVATRENGGIEDLAGGTSRATLRVWLPREYPYSIRASWTDGMGNSIEHEVVPQP